MAGRGAEEDRLLIAAINKKVQGGHRSQRGEIEPPRWTPPSCAICGEPCTDVVERDILPNSDRPWYCSMKCFRVDRLKITGFEAPIRLPSKAPRTHGEGRTGGSAW